MISNYVCLGSNFFYSTSEKEGDQVSLQEKLHPIEELDPETSQWETLKSRVESLELELKGKENEIDELKSELQSVASELHEKEDEIYPKKLEISFYCKTNRVDYS